MTYGHKPRGDSLLKGIAYGVLIGAIAVLVGISLAFAGTAAAAEVTNESVTVTDDTAKVYVEATFPDDAAAGTTAQIVIEDANGSEWQNVSISGNASEIEYTEWNVSDGDPLGDYSVTVDSPDSNVSAYAGILNDTAIGGGGSGGGGSTTDGSDADRELFGYPYWMFGGVIVVVVGVLLVKYRDRFGGYR